MASNRGAAYVGPGKVEMRSIDFPKLIDPCGKRCDLVSVPFMWLVDAAGCARSAQRECA